GRLGLLEDLWELRAVVPEVVWGIGVVADIPGLGVADDRHVVHALAPNAREPLRPLDLLEADLDAGLGQLARDDLARSYRVVVHRRDFQRRLEAVGVASLGRHTPGPCAAG